MMMTNDSRGWIVVSILVVLLAVGVFFAWTVGQSREEAMHAHATAESQAMMVRQEQQQAAMHERMAAYEAQIAAYQAEIERLRHERADDR